MNLRNLKGKIMMVICGAAAFLGAGILIFILAIIFVKGVASLNLPFILVPENVAGRALGTGIANAIVGTILLALTSTILAIPFGVGTAIYLKKYAPDNPFTRFLRLMIEVLAGTPSILLGIVALFLLVVYLKPITGGESLLAGAIALAALVLPVIERATEDAIERVPWELEEGSYALGATKWLTIRNIIIPSAFSGIIIGAILAFGRAAEESAVVLLTAGYSQYMPEFMIRFNPRFLLGIQIYPLNNLVGTLPVFLFTAWENSNVYPVSSIFGAAFVLISIVIFVNLSAKAILFYATAKAQGYQDTGLYSTFCSVSGRFLGKKPKEAPSIIDIVDSVPPDLINLVSPPEKILSSEAPSEHSEDLQNMPNASGVPIAYQLKEPETQVKPQKKTIKAGAGITHLIHALRQRIHSWLHGTKVKNIPANPAEVQRIEDLSAAAAVRREQTFPNGKIIDSVRSFLLTIAPFVLVVGILVGLTVMLPVLSPIGSNGPAGLLTVPLMALILSLIGIVGALFLVRNSTLFLLRRRKGQIGNRRAEFAAVALGCCLVVIAAFIFSAHIFSTVPSIQSSASETSTGTGILSYFTSSGNGGFSFSGLVLNNSLFSFIYKPGTATTPQATDASDRNARLAAFLASQETPTEATPQITPVSNQPSPVPSSSAQVALTGPIVPVKNALDIGESYWYGDNSRPCLATIYNATTMPLYFYWDEDWNRFVQVTPVTNGDTFLVIFIRIEDTGNMSAIVPGADQIIVSYNGQTYTNEPYFDTSVLDSNEISIYTANYNLLPYQWIREIGEQKRDYAFLTGYNIFGQNTTVISNYSGNSQFSPPSPTTPNGEGWFIKPGRSNAIDGYLIYEVPGSVATDLRDTYAVVQFNSFSSTQWRLGK